MVKLPVREELLERLVEYCLPVEPTLAGLREYPWDSEAPLFTLTRQHLLAMLRRYRARDITADQLTDWADLVECRDDICYEVGCKDTLREAIFELANPNLNVPISDAVIYEMEQRFVDAPTI